MTPGEARTILNTQFMAGWDNATSIKLGNDAALLPPDIPWVRFTVQHSGGYAQSWTGEEVNWHYFGMAVAQIYVPLGSGTAVSDGLVLRVIRALQGKALSGIETGAATIREVGNDNAGRWMVNVMIPFFYDGVEDEDAAP